MTTLNDFKALRASVPAEVQTELYSLFTSDPEASFQRMVELAAEKGVSLTVNEVKGFLKQMDEEDEFDDIELDAVALALPGGKRRTEATAGKYFDEPWGRCPACVRRKWLFVGSLERNHATDPTALTLLQWRGFYCLHGPVTKITVADD